VWKECRDSGPPRISKEVLSCPKTVRCVSPWTEDFGGPGSSAENDTDALAGVHPLPHADLMQPCVGAAAVLGGARLGEVVGCRRQNSTTSQDRGSIPCSRHAQCAKRALLCDDIAMGCSMARSKKRQQCDGCAESYDDSVMLRRPASRELGSDCATRHANIVRGHVCYTLLVLGGSLQEHTPFSVVARARHHTTTPPQRRRLLLQPSSQLHKGLVHKRKIPRGR
jgi:hypothetical protein